MIDFSQVLQDLEGVNIKDAGKDITLRKVCVNALVSETEASQKEDGSLKLKRWNLAKKINDAAEPLHLESEDKALIKLKIAAAYTTLVVGQVFEMIESVL